MGLVLQKLQHVSACGLHCFPKWPAIPYATSSISPHLISFFMVTYLVWRPGLTHPFTKVGFTCLSPFFPPSLPHLSSEKGFLTFANFYFFIFSLPNELFTLGLPVLLSWKQPAPPLSLPPTLFAMLAHIWDYELRLLLYWTHLKVAIKRNAVFG